MKTNLNEEHIRMLEKPEITCSDVAHVIGDYVDNDLTIGLRDRIDEHLATCEFCQGFKESYEEVVIIASQLREKPMPKGVRTRLREVLNQRLGLALPTDSVD